MAKTTYGNHVLGSLTLGYRIVIPVLMIFNILKADAKRPAIPRATNIVLVHGTDTDGSGWRGVYDILKQDGYRVSVVQEPLTGLSDDVVATQRVIDQQDGPTILVGHSYGGTIITIAGADPKVRALVYVVAMQPDVGETTNQLISKIPGEIPSSDVRPTKDGFLFINPASFAADFGADLPKAQADFMAHAQMPVAAGCIRCASDDRRMARQAQLRNCRYRRSRTQSQACALDVSALGGKDNRDQSESRCPYHAASRSRKRNRSSSTVRQRGYAKGAVTRPLLTSQHGGFMGKG